MLYSNGMIGLKKVPGSDKMFDNCNLVSRSEFQRLCGGVPRSTLRYYEKAGILKPDYVEENGYQFYNISQVYTYFHILFLKLIDCSVSEISEIFNTPDRDYASLIEKKELVLEESIACLQQISNTLKRMDHMREKFPIEKCGKIRTVHGERIVY